MKTSLDIKHNNQQHIYRLFFQHEQLSKQKISRLLNLSLPTVINNINKLEQERKIQECGLYQPQGGRPATAYQLVKDAYVAIGIEIQKNKIQCIVIDLKGNILLHKNHSITFTNTPDYVENLSKEIHHFIQYCGFSTDSILGIGLSIQGIAHKDGQSMLYSKAFPCDFFDIPTLQKYLDIPILLFHDVKCAATAELWKVQKIENAIYISISEHLGGAIIMNNQIDLGKTGYSGALEHLQIHEQGKPCYCGQFGCLETYCSLSALLNKNETREQFFQLLRQGEKSIISRWEIFLNNLARGLNLVNVLFDRDIILGGKIAPYLIEEDLIQLQQKVERIASFPIERNFIHIAKQQKHATVIGAALPFIIKYLP